MSARPSDSLDAGSFEPERVVIRDKRRIDPESGALREPAVAPAPGAPGSVPPSVSQSTALDPRINELEAQLAERTADVQRVQADYANYRKRVDRDRLAVVEQATVAVLSSMLPVLDDVGRARAHGELEGGFRSVGEALEATATRFGLVRFGDAGEVFDPAQHEALSLVQSPEVTGPTIVEVFQPGYRLGERVVRPARVVVAEPAGLPDPAVSSETA